MICASCGANNAKIFFKKTQRGELKLTLCDKCHALLYPEGETDALFSSFLDVEDSKKRCPACGSTLDDFRRTGLLGCAHCYTAFREELIPTVRSIQGKLRHEGVQQPAPDAAKRYDTFRRLADEKAALQARIEEARRAGDEDTAEMLTARLALLKRKLHEEGDR